MSLVSSRKGSRFLYEPFDSTSARISTYEQVSEARWEALEQRLGHIEDMLDRLERRLWLAVFGVVTAVLTEGALGIVQNAPP